MKKTNNTYVITYNLLNLLRCEASGSVFDGWIQHSGSGVYQG